MMKTLMKLEGTVATILRKAQTDNLIKTEESKEKVRGGRKLSLTDRRLI